MSETPGRSDVAAFVTERLAAMEAAARADYPKPDDDDADPQAWFDAREGHKTQPHSADCGWRTGEGLSATCECGYPAAALSLAAGLRAVMALHVPNAVEAGFCDQCGDPYFWDQTSPEPWPCPTLLAIATGLGWTA